MDGNWNMLTAPKWLRLITAIGKWVLVMMVFVISSISMAHGNDPQGMWTAIWCLTMVKIVDMAEEKI
tara:strand:+ start:80 stop:280 length:201 start_codon:yes stop_codon:yes gene_type:complete